MNNPSSAARTRAVRPQFSLRLLLLALTAFGIGFPIWYRRPYEEVSRETPAGTTPEAKEISTWQRQWGGARLKHGIERLIVDSRTVCATMYRNGLRHGPRRGENFAGQYVDGMREGIWTDNSRWFKRTATWLHDRLEGPAEIEYPDGRKFSLQFSGGRLTHLNGQPASNRLYDLLESQTDEMDVRIREELQKNTSCDCVEVPLKDVVGFLSELHSIPITLDSGRVSRVDLPITCELRGIDLCSALTLLTAPHDLGCDYRYGCLWITTAEDAKDWHDPTGVADIKPPKGSALARAWKEPVTFDAVNMPLAEALAQVVRRLAIEIDAAWLAPTPQNPAPIRVTASVRGLPFRDVLGILLNNAGCRCKLEGEKLEILPPASESP